MARPLTIGQVAKTSGVAAKTIRYYEQIGVLPVPSRSASGYRLYDQAGVERLRLIRRARSLGLPLRQLKTLTNTLNGGPRPALRPRLLELVGEQLAAVQDQIAGLELLRQHLEQVSQRMLTSAGGRHRGSCRCLETEAGTARQPRRSARPRGRF